MTWALSPSETANPTYTEVYLSDISLVLLTEIYNDYALLASKTMGFDPDWVKKTPW